MNRTVRDKEELLQAIARQDLIYQEKMRESSALERKFDKMIGELDDPKRDIAWDFVMQNEDIGQYMLYLACKFMEFKDIKDHEFSFSDDFAQRKSQAEEMAKKLSYIQNKERACCSILNCNRPQNYGNVHILRM